MEQRQIDELVAKYNAGEADAREIKVIEGLIENGQIDLTDLKGLQSLQEEVMKIELPSPSLVLDDHFYHMLAQEKRSSAAPLWKRFFAWPEFAPRLAFASVTLVIGVVAGYFLRPASSEPVHGQMQALSQQVADLQEMMMLSLLEKESATDRLKAVSLTQEMDQASQKVTQALLETLNHDSNVNVRLAALDVLSAYAKDDQVREGLIRAIAKQDSPLVQLALAELMAQLQVKSSVKELEKVLENDKTPKDVKRKIRESIDVLI